MRGNVDIRRVAGENGFQFVKS